MTLPGSVGVSGHQARTGIDWEWVAKSVGDVLRGAQADGLAEADPSFDVDGIDAAHKLALLTAVAYGRPVDFAGVAKSLGLEAIKVTDPGELKSTLSSAFSRPGTKLVEVVVNNSVN